MKRAEKETEREKERDGEKINSETTVLLLLLKFGVRIG